MLTKLGKRILQLFGTTSNGSTNIVEYYDSTGAKVQSINTYGQMELTEEYVWVGDSTDRSEERAVANQIVGVDSLIDGQCTVIDTRITNNSIVVYGISNVGILSGSFSYDVSTAEQCVFSSSINTDTVTFSYIIIL
jgi:hypothetical protein